METKYSTKMPDMSQNTKLAGKTVYTNGMNVHYDQLGYAVWSENPNHPNYKGTTKSVHAQPIEDALAGKKFEEDWSGLVDWNFGQPDYTKTLTKENEAAARERYYKAVAAEDEARRNYGEKK